MSARNAIHKTTLALPIGDGPCILEERHNGGLTEAIHRNTAQVECTITKGAILAGYIGSGALVLTLEAQRGLEAGLATLLREKRLASEKLSPFVTIRSVVSQGLGVDGTCRALVSFEYLRGATYSDGD